MMLMSKKGKKRRRVTPTGKSCHMKEKKKASIEMTNKHYNESSWQSASVITLTNQMCLQIQKVKINLLYLNSLFTVKNTHTSKYTEVKLNNPSYGKRWATCHHWSCSVSEILHMYWTLQHYFSLANQIWCTLEHFQYSTVHTNPVTNHVFSFCSHNTLGRIALWDSPLNWSND